eukprot:4059884-Pleurochrysis_carterae.AAC.2
MCDAWRMQAIFDASLARSCCARHQWRGRGHNQHGAIFQGSGREATRAPVSEAAGCATQGKSIHCLPKRFH